MLPGCGFLLIVLWAGCLLYSHHQISRAHRITHSHTLCSPAALTLARFEEPGGANIISHPRVIEGTVRKEESKRKRQREAKKQRQAAEEEERRTEVKRLKNEKRRDIEDRLSKLQQVGRSSAGHGSHTCNMHQSSVQEG
jgi:hypothetical protein